MLKSAHYYWVECDGCGERCEYGEFAAFADESAAIDGAIDHDWSASNTEPEKHHCPDCPRFCEAANCGEVGTDPEDIGEWHCPTHCEPSTETTR